MNTQIKELDSVEQGVIIKSYDELIQLAIHLNHFRYDVTAKGILKLIEQKLLRDMFDCDILIKHYHSTKDIDAMFVNHNRLVELDSLHMTISNCINSDNPMDIEYWLENNITLNK
jgi:hypothetical protein